jgi:hypothetical protein
MHIAVEVRLVVAADAVNVANRVEHSRRRRQI